MTNVQFDSIEEYEDIETLNMYKERLEKDISQKKSCILFTQGAVIMPALQCSGAERKTEDSQQRTMVYRESKLYQDQCQRGTGRRKFGILLLSEADSFKKRKSSICGWKI